jgi:hypothetical protein
MIFGEHVAYHVRPHPLSLRGGGRGRPVRGVPVDFLSARR